MIEIINKIIEIITYTWNTMNNVRIGPTNLLNFAIAVLIANVVINLYFYTQTKQ